MLRDDAHAGHKRQIIVYSKPGCHLCDELLEEIGRAGDRELYTLEVIDIRSDPELVRKYGWDIPVVLIDGVHAFKHRLTAEEFNRALRKA